ncbi:hypothetical protein GEMRC1_008118 [Eukaryota sp. GEM-RC1]
MPRSDDLLQSLLECLELRQDQEVLSPSFSSRSTSSLSSPDTSYISPPYVPEVHVHSVSSSVSSPSSARSPFSRLKGLASPPQRVSPPKSSRQPSSRPRTSRSSPLPSSRVSSRPKSATKSVIYPQNPQKPHKNDPVSRFHELNQSWAQDPFLKRKSGRPKNAHPPVLRTSAPTYRIQSQPTRPSSYQVPTEKRRDKLRWEVRHCLNDVS